MENEDIPGKRLFAVTNKTGGLLVPACQTCNGSWSCDQEFVRLRIVLHAGSHEGAGHIRLRELRRLTGSEAKKPQVARYLKERAKLYVVNGREIMGLTDTDLGRISSVMRHWAAGIHYWRRKTRAALPGSVHLKFLQPDFFRRMPLPPEPHGKWIETDGTLFGCWWFFPGAATTESITVFNLLQQDALWFGVRFPALS